VLACLISAVAGAQTISNVPAPLIGFTDISGSGTALTGAAGQGDIPGDDTESTFTSTVGNGLFPAGGVIMGSNGMAISGGTYSAYNSCCSQVAITGATTGANFGYPAAAKILAPYYTDLYCSSNPNTTMYWQEFAGVVLIMQWNNVEKFSYVGAGTVTFQIQVFQGVCGSPDQIQYLLADTTFAASGPVALFNNGGGDPTNFAHTMIGYVGGAYGNAAWSYDTAGSAPDGTCLTIAKGGPFTATWSSPLGVGSVQLDICNGPPGGSYVLPLTFYAGNFPNGWLNGLAIPIDELNNELGTGFPFVGISLLNGSGAFTLGPFQAGFLSGLTFYSLVYAIPSGSPVPSAHTPATSYSIP